MTDILYLAEAGADMLTYVGEYRELFDNHPEFPSMRDSFQETPYKGQGRIIHYLRKGGMETMVSGKLHKDCFTGEVIPYGNIGRDDGEYTWWTSLAHYVEKYNLRLPEGFENKIMSTPIS